MHTRKTKTSLFRSFVLSPPIPLEGYVGYRDKFLCPFGLTIWATRLFLLLYCLRLENVPTGVAAIVVFHIRANSLTANAPPDMKAIKIARMTQFHRLSRVA
jgi:hypothetical protein